MPKKQSYRALQSELDKVLTELQSTESDIDKALDLYKQGQELIKQLEEHLLTAKNTVEHLKT